MNHPSRFANVYRISIQIPEKLPRLSSSREDLEENPRHKRTPCTNCYYPNATFLEQTTKESPSRKIEQAIPGGSFLSGKLMLTEASYRKKSLQSSSNVSQLRPLLSSEGDFWAAEAVMARAPPLAARSSYMRRGERQPIASHGEILHEKLAPFRLSATFLAPAAAEACSLEQEARVLFWKSKKCGSNNDEEAEVFL